MAIDRVAIGRDRRVMRTLARPKAIVGHAHALEVYRTKQMEAVEQWLANDCGPLPLGAMNAANATWQVQRRH